jgi:hypothetical protein
MLVPILSKNRNPLGLRYLDPDKNRSATLSSRGDKK